MRLRPYRRLTTNNQEGILISAAIKKWVASGIRYYSQRQFDIQSALWEGIGQTVSGDLRNKLLLCDQVHY
jgi:hypothetical protein